MGSVINLAAAKEARSSHTRGAVKCMTCKHEWQAVAPSQDDPRWTLECPECSLFTGVWKGAWAPDKKFAVFTCDTCEGQLYMLLDSGEKFCIGCGTYSTLGDL